MFKLAEIKSNIIQKGNLMTIEDLISGSPIIRKFSGSSPKLDSMFAYFKEQQIKLEKDTYENKFKNNCYLKIMKWQNEIDSIEWTITNSKS